MSIRYLLLPLFLFIGVALAQSVPEIGSFIKQGQEQIQTGAMTPLAFYRELHRRIAATPIAAYPEKAANLRRIGQRVDIYEDVEAGKITLEKGERLISEQEADWESEKQQKTRAAEASMEQQRAGEFARREQADAADLARRRALASQLIQSGALNARPIPFVPIPPIPAQPRSTLNCTSSRVGNNTQTYCN